MERTWQQRAGIFIGVILLQVAMAVAFIKGGMMKVPLLTHPLMMVDVHETLPERPDVEPPPPPQVVPITPEVPVVFDVASDTAITVPKPKEKAVERTQPSTGYSDSQAIVTKYQIALLRHLAAYKRYPAAARARRQEGIVMVRFTMDRSGRVMSAALANSSHSKPLDDEGVAILERASPLPAPPPEVKGDPVTLVVPIEFSLH
jgi:protein TonB